MPIKMSIQELKQQNKLLKQRVIQFKNKSPQNNIHQEINTYKKKLQDAIEQIKYQSADQEQKLTEKLHALTQDYQNLLKQQITLLTQNKTLTQKKDQQNQKLNLQMQKITKQYEAQILNYEKKVQINVKKIKQMNGTNIIKLLIKNEKFKKVMAQRNCNLEGLQKQSELQQIANEVEEKQKMIEAAELKSKDLDEQLQKMQQLILTMKQLMENMQKQKENILKQNTILKQKLVQSEQLIGKLLGNQQNKIPEQQNQESQSSQNQNQ